VWLDGGPVTGTDKELRQAVCERHDTAVAAERTAREQAEQERDRLRAAQLSIAGLVNTFHNDGTGLSATETLRAVADVLGAALSPQDGQSELNETFRAYVAEARDTEDAHPEESPQDGQR
jgi:hypothetical protein